MADGNKHAKYLPRTPVDEVRRKIEAGRGYQDAVRDVPAANAGPLVLARKQRLKRSPVSGTNEIRKKCLQLDRMTASNSDDASPDELSTTSFPGGAESL
jgi:hypothetical protein